MKLKELLQAYKEVTLDFIELVNSEGDAEKALVKREEILEVLKSSEYDIDELKAVAKELELIELEQKAYQAIEAERNKLKEEIIKLKMQKEAQKSYGNSFGNINFINEKI